MKNIKLRSLLKSLMVGVCSLAMLTTISTNVYAFDPEEGDVNCPHTHVQQMFNQPIPCGQGSKMDTLITICNDCGGVVKTEDVMREDPHGKNTEEREDGIYCSACGERIEKFEKEEQVKEEETFNYNNEIKQQRKNLLNDGINNRSNTHEFEVFVNSSKSDVKLDVNDKINVDEYGMCKGEHRMVSYFTKQGEFLVHVSKCFDCLDQRITNVDKVMDGMNLVGSSNIVKSSEQEETVESKINHFTDEELAEIMKNYKLAEIKAAIESLE